MSSVEPQKRIKLMQELKKINEGNEYFDILTQSKEHEVALKQIEGRVLGFFKGGQKFDQEAFDYYLSTLGDLTMVERILGKKELGVYNEKNGLKQNGFKYTIINTYVEFAKKFKEEILWEIRNRKGVDKELGHYQRNVRKGFGQLEGKKIGAADRVRMLVLYPHLLYKQKLDIQQIADIWDIDRTNAVRNMKKLTSEESGKAMIEDKQGRKKVYSFNPKYTFSGSGGKEHDVKVYVSFLQEVIKEVKELEKELAIELGVKELKHSALAVLHTIIPYFHYETCYAVKNPEEPICREGETIEEAIQREVEEDTESPLEYLNVDQIASIVAKKSTDRNYIKRSLYVLEKAGAILYTANTILINPKLMWSMDDILNKENNPYVNYVLFQFKVEKDARKKQRGFDDKKSKMVKKKSSAKTRTEE